MSILRPDVAPTFGTLDSTAIVETTPPDAHVMRTIATSANRLMCRPEPLVNLIWDVGSTATEAGGSVEGYAPPIWIPVIPGYVTSHKKPGLTVGTLFVYAKITSGETVYAQVATRARPFAESGGVPLTMLGTGSWAEYTLTGVPLVYETEEQIAVYVMGVVTATAGVTATYGSPNTGVVDRVLENGSIIFDVGAAWNPSPGTSWSRKHAIVCKDASSNVVLTRWIVDVPADGYTVRIYPAIESPSLATTVEASTYSIYQLPYFRLGQIAVYATERVP